MVTFFRTNALIAVLLFAVTALAKSDARSQLEGCAPIRLDAPGYSMEHVPPANQQTGNCYAVAAAQAYDAYRFSHGDKRYELLTSRYDLTFRSSKSSQDKSFGNGGFFTEVMSILSNEPPCPLKRRDLIGEEKNIDRLEKFAADSQDQIFSMQKQIEGYKIRPNMTSMRFEEFKPLAAQSARQNLASCAESSHLSSRRVQGIDDILELIENRDVMRFLSEAVKTTCKDSQRLRVSPPYMLTGSGLRDDGLPYDEIGGDIFPWQKKALSVIQEDLILGKNMAQPKVISFCSKVLNGDSEDPSKVRKKSRTEECGNHVALVIGQRVNPKTGKCDFLLRNSWGKTYGKYSSLWEEEIGKGNVWIDAEVLMKNTYRLNGLH